MSFLSSLKERAFGEDASIFFGSSNVRFFSRALGLAFVQFFPPLVSCLIVFVFFLLLSSVGIFSTLIWSLFLSCSVRSDTFPVLRLLVPFYLFNFFCRKPHVDPFFFGSIGACSQSFNFRRQGGRVSSGRFFPPIAVVSLFHV